MSNYGQVAVDVLGGLQAQDIAAAKAPVELQLMKARTDLAQTQASGAKLAQEMQLSGIKALSGFKFDSADPARSMVEMAGRLAGTNPVLAGKIATDAQMAMWRQSQAENAKSLADARALAAGVKKVQAIGSSYGNLTSTDPAHMQAADSLFGLQMMELGAKPEEIAAAIQTIHKAIETGGPGVIEQIHQQGMTQAQIGQEKLRQANLERQKEHDAKTQAYHNAELDLAKQRLEREKARDAARAKAGGGKEPRPRLSIGESLKDAAAVVNADPILSNGDGALKLKWTRIVGSKAIEKIDGSYAEHLRNPNIPIMSKQQALSEAMSEVKQGVKEDPSALAELGKKLGVKMGARKAVEKQPKPGAPSLEDFLAKARKANPGASDEKLREYWESKYAQ